MRLVTVESVTEGNDSTGVAEALALLFAVDDPASAGAPEGAPAPVRLAAARRGGRPEFILDGIQVSRAIDGVHAVVRVRTAHPAHKVAQRILETLAALGETAVVGIHW